MQNLIKSIVLAILGLAALLVAIFTDAGIASIVVGGLLTFAGIVWLVLDLVKANKNK